RLGWALGGATTVTVPIGEFGYNDSGDVVVWNETVAGELFTALANDQPVPQSVLDAQP
ncbi:MAG TPA: LytR family transcriptional regulator, partial [Mycobacterium sp.]|nr:LytR family transcriptional regulator [Mycobacterium sp.]